MNKEVLISIIIPTYNCEEKILKLLDSLYIQKTNKLEIIFVDNNSTDNTVMVIKKYLKKDKRAKLYKEIKQGPNYARKTGFDNSNGKYIFFIDCDDYLEKNTISLFIKCINKTKADVVIGNYREIYNNFSNIKKCNYKVNKKVILLCKPSLWYKVFKRNLINDDSFIYTSIGEDMHISILALARAKNIKHIPNVVYNYVINNNGLSYKVSYKKSLDSLKTLKEMKNTFIKNNLYNKYKEEIEYVMICHSLYRAFEAKLLNNKNERNSFRKDTINFLKNIDIKNNKYYKKSITYKLTNFFVHSSFLYNTYTSKLLIKLLFTNKTLNKMLKKLDK